MAVDLNPGISPRLNVARHQLFSCGTATLVQFSYKVTWEVLTQCSDDRHLQFSGSETLDMMVQCAYQIPVWYGHM